MSEYRSVKRRLFKNAAWIFFGAPTLVYSNCYQVKPVESIDATNCGEVIVGIEKVECDNVTKSIKAYKSRSASIECAGDKKTLKVPFDGGYLESELKVTQLWGKPSVSIGESKYVADASFARSAKKVELKAEAKAEPENYTKAENLKRLAKISKEKPAEKGVESPKVTAIEEKTDKKIEWSASGNIWMEAERAKNFGYDGDSGLTNFSNSPQQGHSSLRANMELGAKKGDSGVFSLIEVGEIFAGDESSGGAVASRGKILEIRNLYFSHDLTENCALSFGIKGIASDPNAYVVADDYYTVSLDSSKEGYEGSIWVAQATGNRPGIGSDSPDHVESDQLLGAQKSYTFNESVKGTGFLVGRQTRESFYHLSSAGTVSGNSYYGWVGNTWAFGLSESWSLEATGIYNFGRFVGDSKGPKDTSHAYLADLKVNYAIKSTETEIGLEGISTSGANDSVAAGQDVQTLGKRKSFSAVGPTYLLTLATSAGADDAPGAPKESTIGDLNMVDGVQIAVLRVGQKISDQWSGLVRYGFLRAAQSSSSGSVLGHEVDLRVGYEISEELSLQGDVAVFLPGSYFDNDEMATLLATRINYSF